VVVFTKLDVTQTLPNNKDRYPTMTLEDVVLRSVIVISSGSWNFYCRRFCVFVSYPLAFLVTLCGSRNLKNSYLSVC